MRKLIVLAAATVLVGSFSISALAQGKRKGNNYQAAVGFALALEADANLNGLPNWGDQVSFSVSSTETNDAHVQLICSQNGEVVYGATWPMTPVLTLRSQLWQSGAADCTATAYYIASGTKKVTIGSMNFTVNE